MSMDILRPTFLKDFETLNILVVCESKDERNNLGEAIFDIHRPFGVTVFTKKCLPLTVACQQAREHFDFIVFMIDLRRRESWPSIKKSLEFVHMDYFLGKCCFVVHLDSSSNQTEEVKLVEKLYRTRVFYTDFSNEKEIQEVASQLMVMAGNSCGWNEEFLKL